MLGIKSVYTGGRKKNSGLSGSFVASSGSKLFMWCRLPTTFWLCLASRRLFKSICFPLFDLYSFFVWTIDDIFLDSGILHLKLVTATRLATCSKKHVAKTLEALMYNTETTI
ncbi:hypothetical protein PVAP13_9KG519626 [Panicum virgatum]|uniref:Uncharacterized protein n=1 Tax=Panicum virgatum TaxID=38727 RepID=A0A8T0NZ91_PANVG|nr:hypothetical protein PVAP13_9KG519626 [Panicum virgatum]